MKKALLLMVVAVFALTVFATGCKKEEPVPPPTPVVKKSTPTPTPEPKTDLAPKMDEEKKEMKLDKSGGSLKPKADPGKKSKKLKK